MSDYISPPSLKEYMVELGFDVQALREKKAFKTMLTGISTTREKVNNLTRHPQVIAIAGKLRQTKSVATDVFNHLQESIPQHLNELRDEIKRLPEHPKVTAAAEQITEYVGTVRKHITKEKLTELAWQAGGTCKFIAQLALHPRRVGAICPSGQFLAERMAELIPDDDSGYVIEFGAGTGSVTKAILERGINPERFIAIEYSEDFCKILRKKFPDITIINGDAAEFARYVPEGAKISAIVSSLPLINLPKDTCTAIIDGIKRNLAEDGCVVQFTYALWGASLFKDSGYRCDASRFAILNLPPARVDRFRTN